MLWVADSLDINASGVFINQVLNVGRVIAMDKLDVDLELLHVKSELVVRAAIEPAGADKIVAWLTTIGEGHELASTDQYGSQKDQDV